MTKNAAGDKRKQRKQLRAVRRALTAQDQQSRAQQLARAFFRSSVVLRYQTFAAYLPNDGEIDPMPMLHRLNAIGKTLRLPRIIQNWHGRHMVFQSYQPGDRLRANRYRILEPCGAYPNQRTHSSVVLAPLVAFDQQGSRLGMGGGYYDRYLARHPGVVYVGLAHHFQGLTTSLPKEPWDQPLDAVVTERGWQYFSQRGRQLAPQG